MGLTLFFFLRWETTSCPWATHAAWRSKLFLPALLFLRNLIGRVRRQRCVGFEVVAASLLNEQEDSTRKGEVKNPNLPPKTRAFSPFFMPCLSFSSVFAPKMCLWSPGRVGKKKSFTTAGARPEDGMSPSPPATALVTADAFFGREAWMHLVMLDHVPHPLA